jgi:hypothetical protein
MITSQKQLLAAKEKVKMLKESLVTEQEKSVPEVLKLATIGQIEELISEIESEINEYELLKSNKSTEIQIFSLEDLMNAPIKYRIAKGMTIEDFARKVHIHSRQIARYEHDHYHNATTDTLLKILVCLDVKISGMVKL